MAAPPPLVAPTLPPPPVPEAPACVPKVSDGLVATPLLPPVGPPTLAAPTLSLAVSLPPPAFSPRATAMGSPQGSPKSGERTPLSIATALFGPDETSPTIGACSVAAAAEAYFGGAGAELFCV
jgi:hypothetical protein